MDPDSDSEDLREDGTLLPSAGAASHEPKHPRGQSPMGRRRRRGISRLAVMMSILGISALMIVGFAMLKFTAQVRVPAPPPKEPPAEPPAESAVPDPAESEASPPPPELKPVADPFNLRTTGFVVSDKPQTREFVFNITRGRSSPDGVSKEMILVNGQSPGPLIQANKGDKLQITVHNSMPKERTSIHWHGIDQKNSVFMDGVYRVTECGIPPGESFTYVFEVVDQRGSFWYHGHVSAQYTDGLFGPLIIHDPDEKIPPVEEDRVIMIGDHYHVDAEEALSIYTGTTTDGGREPRPDNILINGRNTYDCSPASSNRARRASKARQEDPTRHVPAGCSTGSIYSARVPSKRRVRLRLISHSSNIPLWFTVDSHVLEIVEIDGVEVEPIKTTRVFLNAGQRYSVVFTTDQPAGNYLMRAIALKGCAMLGGSFGSHLAKVNYEATGILSYDNVDVNDRPVGKAWDMRAESLPDSTSEPWTQKCRDLPFDLPKPVRAMKAYEAGERNKHQAVFSQGNHNGVYRSFVNSVVFSPLNDSATVWQTSRQNLSLANLESSTPKWDFGADQNILVSRDDDKAAQIAISANQMMSHPWHLHGQNFQIVGWGKGLFGMGETTWNLDNPMRRDTVLVGSHSHVVIRYVATNPGVWALHCHIQWHAEGGMFATTAQRLAELNTLIDSLDSDKGAGLGRKFCKR